MYYYYYYFFFKMTFYKLNNSVFLFYFKIHYIYKHQLFQSTLNKKTILIKITNNLTNATTQKQVSIYLIIMTNNSFWAFGPFFYAAECC